MSDSFDSNLLSQVNPLDRKLSISKEFVGTVRKQKRDEQRKGNHFLMKKREEGVYAENENTASPAQSDPVATGTIDITI